MEFIRIFSAWMLLILSGVNLAIAVPAPDNFGNWIGFVVCFGMAIIVGLANDTN